MITDNAASPLAGDNPLAGLSGVPAGAVTANPLPISPGATALATPPNTIPPIVTEQTEPKPEESPTGSFSQKVARAADKLGIPSNQPGGWARSLVGAAQSALSGLANASTTPAKPGGSGILEGVTETLANRANAQRQAKLDAQNAANQQATNAREDAKLSMAKENAMMLHDQILNSHLETGRQNTISTGNKSIQPYLKANAPIVQEGVDSDQINTMIRQNKLNPTQVHAFATGEKPVGAPDANGEQNYRVTYTIVGDVPEVTVDKDMASYLQKWTRQPVQEGQPMDGIHYGMLTQQANSAETASLAQDEIRRKAGLAEADDEQKQRIVNMGPLISEALSKAGNDPVKALTTLTSPEVIKINPHAATDARAALFGSKEDPTGVTEYNKFLHDRAEEQATKDKENDKKLEETEFGDMTKINDPKAFASSMAPQAKALVDMIGTGGITLPNLAYVIGRKPEIAEAVSVLYPDFNSAKAASYPSLYKEFTSGKTGEQLNAGATAVRHLKELWDLDDAWTAAVSAVGATKASPQATAYHNKADTVAAELAAFYKENNIPGVQRIIDDLNSLTPGTRRSAIQTQAGSMADKFDEFRNQWNSGAPSAKFQSEMPHNSPIADASANFLENGGKYIATAPDGKQYPMKDAKSYITFMQQVKAHQAQNPQQSPQQNQNPQ